MGKNGRKKLAYESLEEKECRHIAYEKWYEHERLRIAAEAELRKVNEQLDKDRKLLQDFLIGEGLNEEEAKKLSHDFLAIK